jgi:hypothetical protein
MSVLWVATDSIFFRTKRGSQPHAAQASSKESALWWALKTHWYDMAWHRRSSSSLQESGIMAKYPLRSWSEQSWRMFSRVRTSTLQQNLRQPTSGSS